MRTLFQSALVFSFVCMPLAVRAQQPPSYPQDPYYAMPAPQGQAYGAPESGYQQQQAAEPYGQLQPAPGMQDGVGYDDAAAEAAADAAAEQAAYVDDGYDREAYVDFQASLSPYGQWVSSPEYGQVWMPSTSVVGADFSPYATGGHWALTEYGWTWVSDWDWGWGPFHYGRWMTYGSSWCWLPGRVWGPSWVSWRWGGGYAGWAPLGPRGVTIGAPPPGRMNGWRFTTSAGLLAPHPAYVGAPAVSAAWSATTPLRNTQVVNRFRVEAGPQPHLVANAVGHPLQPSAVHGFAAAAPRATIVPRVAPLASSSHYAGSRPMPPNTFGGRPTGATTLAPRPYASAPYLHPTPSPSAGYAPAYNPGYRAPAYQAAPIYRAPSYSAPAYQAPSYAAPSYHAAPSYSAPSYHAAPSYSAPSYSAPSYHSAPSYSAPSYHSAPSYSAPSYHSAPSYSAPSYHSAPSYSAPHFGGGGGGGGFRGGHR